MEEETEDHALGALGALGDLVVLGVFRALGALGALGAWGAFPAPSLAFSCIPWAFPCIPLHSPYIAPGCLKALLTDLSLRICLWGISLRTFLNDFP
jgi:hypothetical protein